MLALYHDTHACDAGWTMGARAQPLQNSCPPHTCAHAPTPHHHYHPHHQSPNPHVPLPQAERAQWWSPPHWPMARRAQCSPPTPRSRTMWSASPRGPPWCTQWSSRGFPLHLRDCVAGREVAGSTWLLWSNPVESVLTWSRVCAIVCVES